MNTGAVTKFNFPYSFVRGTAKPHFRHVLQESSQWLFISSWDKTSSRKLGPLGVPTCRWVTVGGLPGGFATQFFSFSRALAFPEETSFRGLDGLLHMLPPILVFATTSAKLMFVPGTFANHGSFVVQLVFVASASVVPWRPRRIQHNSGACFNRSSKRPVVGSVVFRSFSSFEGTSGGASSCGRGALVPSGAIPSAKRVCATVRRGPGHFGAAR